MFKKINKRRYDKEDNQDYSDEEDNDEEEMRNIRDAVKRGEKAKFV